MSARGFAVSESSATLNPKPQMPADWHERAQVLADRHRPNRPDAEAHFIVQRFRAGPGKFSYQILLTGQQHADVLTEKELLRAMLKEIEKALA